MAQSFTLTGYAYGATVALSALVFLIACRLLRRERTPDGTLHYFALFALPLGLLCARAVFCLVNVAYYTETIAQPWLMLRFWDGGYSLMGMLMGLALAAKLAAGVVKTSFGAVMDAVCAPTALLIAGLRIAERFTDLGVGRSVEAGALAQSLPILFVQERFGTLTLTRLAVWRWEAAAALALFAIFALLMCRRSKRRKARPGDLALLFYACYGSSQVLLESLRDDGHLLIGFIRISQVLAVSMPILATGVFSARYARIRGADGRITLAWLLAPITAVLIVMMFVPINHVLDLTDKRLLGAIPVAVFALFMAWKLRVKGADLRLILSWLAVLVCVAACVMLEFAIDGSTNLALDYALMAVCCAGLALVPISLWRALKNKLYLEERFTVRVE